MKNIKITKSEKESWDYIKNYNHIDFLEPGQIVIYKNKYGTVIGCEKQYIIIHIPGEGTGVYNPSWNIAYLDVNGKIIKDFREEKYKSRDFYQGNKL